MSLIQFGGCDESDASKRKRFTSGKPDSTSMADNKNMVSTAVCGILGSGEQTRIESCIIRIPESMVESQQCSPN
jgi:hypothetical protein